MDQESTKDTLAIGKLGECVAAKYLENLGFQVIIRNYRKKYGEIDIVAQKKDTVHFVEVKTVSHGTRRELESLVTRETWHPEELVHYSKLRQIKKAAESWILEHSWAGAVQIDVAAVRMVPREKFATVNLISNVGLD